MIPHSTKLIAKLASNEASRVLLNGPIPSGLALSRSEQVSPSEPGGRARTGFGGLPPQDTEGVWVGRGRVGTQNRRKKRFS